MITPRFSCSQDDNSVTVSIYAPSIRATEVSLVVEGCVFTLNVNPYFLRINFPSALVEDDTSSASYDPSTGYLTVRLAKVVSGHHFRDLDLIGKLMAAAAPSAPKNAVVEVLDDEDDEDRKSWLLNEREAILQAEAHDWHLPPSPPSPVLSTALVHPYGFLNLHTSYFPRATDTENEVNIFGSEAETLTDTERWARLSAHEEAKWDPEHYMADWLDEEAIVDILKQASPFGNLRADVQFTEEENEVLLKLPRREYLLTPALMRSLYLNLICILFSAAYDTLTTFSEPTSQSAWTISALTPHFVALSPPPLTSTLRTSTIASYRRALAYPLYRHFVLCERLQDEVAGLVSSGRRSIVKVLVATRHILDGGCYSAYARIWIDDYIRWVQIHASDETLHSLGRELKYLKLEKRDIGWPLEELEARVLQDYEGDSDSDDDPLL